MIWKGNLVLFTERLREKRVVASQHLFDDRGQQENLYRIWCCSGNIKTCIC
jgi:hypothetical protein